MAGEQAGRITGGAAGVGGGEHVGVSPVPRMGLLPEHDLSGRGGIDGIDERDIGPGASRPPAYAEPPPFPQSR